MLIDDFGDDSSAIIAGTNVALVDRDGGMEFLGELFPELLCAGDVAAVPGCDGGALARQAGGDGCADAPGSAGDQGNFSGQLVAGHC